MATSGGSTVATTVAGSTCNQPVLLAISANIVKAELPTIGHQPVILRLLRQLKAIGKLCAQRRSVMMPAPKVHTAARLIRAMATCAGRRIAAARVTKGVSITADPAEARQLSLGLRDGSCRKDIATLVVHDLA